MSLLADGLIGSQRPRVLTVPPRVSSAGPEAVELAASAGLVLDPWQELVLEEALGERADGRWSAFEVGLIVPRQNGKGSVLEARELAGLFVLGERLIMHSAHEFKTAAEAFLRILTLIENTPDLDAQVRKVTRSHGEEGIETKSGARLRFVARSTGSGRGFSGDCVILDEAYNLPAASIAALLPTMSARPNPQLWYTSSAGMPESTQLRRLRQRGIEGATRLCYLEWSAPEGSDPLDRSAWAQANPGLGIRIGEEFVESEQSALPAEEFGRERLGLWASSEIVQAIPAEQWKACLDGGSQPGPKLHLAFDVNPERSMTAIAVASRRPDGRLHVEVIEHRPGTSWVAARLKELVDRHHPDTVRAAPNSPAGALLGAVAEAGVTVAPVSSTDHAQACGAFYDAALDGRLAHRGQDELDVALAGAAKQPVGDSWLWSRKHSKADISPLVAATLALGAVPTSAPTPGFRTLDDLLDDDEE